MWLIRASLARLMRRYPEAVSPSYLRIYAAQLISEVGDWGGRIALYVFVQRQTGSSFLGALVLALMVAGYLAGDCLGALADRLPPVRLMVSADLVRAVCFAVLVLLPAGRWLVPLDLALMITASSASALFEATRSTAQNDLGSWNLARQHGLYVSLAAQLGSFALGGFLVTVLGPNLVLWLNAATFIGSAAVLYGLKLVKLPASGDEVKPQSGLSTIRRDPVLRLVAVTVALGIGAAAVWEQYVPILVQQSFGLHSWLLYGLPITCVAATLVSTIVTSRREAGNPLRMLFMLMVAMLGLTVVLLWPPVRAFTAIPAYTAIGVIFSTPFLAKGVVAGLGLPNFGAVMGALQGSLQITTSLLLGLTSLMISLWGPANSFRILAVFALVGMAAMWLIPRSSRAALTNFSGHPVGEKLRRVDQPS